MRIGLIACCLLAAAPSAHAQVPLMLEGQMTQGALIVGRTARGAMVTLDGKPLAVDAGGAFAFGLPHDAKPEWTLIATAPGLGSATRTLRVSERRYAEQHIDGVPDRFVEPPPEIMKRLEDEYHLVRRARETNSALPFFRTGFIWPALGRVSGVYGSRRIVNGKPLRPHFGVDVAAPVGTPVRAAAAGAVTLAHDDLYFSGKTVLIDHGLGVSTVYIHMNELTVKTGDQVRRGQQIGTIGSTGRSTGPHLHWGLNWFQDYLDPATVVGPMPSSSRENPSATKAVESRMGAVSRTHDA